MTMPFGSPFSFDLSNHPCHLDGNRMHGNVAAQPIDEGQPTLLVRVCFCAISAVDQFGDGHD
jgi:hypothetical protein